MKRILFISLPLILIALYLIGKPIIRSQKFSTLAFVEAYTQTYDCSGESCIGFMAKKIVPNSFVQFQNQLLIPYYSDKSRDETQQEISTSIGISADKVCISGYIHKYAVDALGFFHPASGSYKIEVETVSLGDCHISSP